VEFCQIIVTLYPHMPTNFGPFTLIFNKMVLIFLAVLIIFYRFEFQVSTSQTALTSWLMMSGLNSPNLNPGLRANMLES